MKKVYFFACLFMLFLPFLLCAQDSVNVQDLRWKGYVKSMHSTWVRNPDSNWTTWSLLHGRMDLSWQPSSQLSLFTGLRTQMTYGGWMDLMAAAPGFANREGKDRGWMDLSGVVTSGPSYLWKAQADRLYTELHLGNLNLRVGRQRINWGMGLVWNPNDIFNAWSWFDFDYEERPGSDAVRAEYYTGVASSLQGAASLDSSGRLTAAGLYRFAWKGYDLQGMAGITPDDFTLGGGWAGHIRGAGFRGECTWFVPRQGDQQDAVVLLALEADYTFRNSMYLHLGFLFNSNGITGKSGETGGWIQREVNAKFFTPSRYTVFSQWMYPLNPIVSAGVSCMLNPTEGSVFVNPSLDVSLADNWQLFVSAQISEGETERNTEDLVRLLISD